MMTLVQDLRYALRTALRRPWLFADCDRDAGARHRGEHRVLHDRECRPARAAAVSSSQQLVRVTVDLHAAARAGRRAVDSGTVRPAPERTVRRSAGIWPVSANLTETDEPERVETALVDANYFSMLGVGAQVGRVFGAADGQPGITEVAVISDALWQRRFGGDPHVLGKRIASTTTCIDHRRGTQDVSPSWCRRTATDVEVAPAGWPGVAVSNAQPIRRAYTLQGALGRLKAGVTPALAQQRVDALIGALRTQYPVDIRRAPLGAARHPAARRSGRRRSSRAADAARRGRLRAADRLRERRELLLARSSVRQREIAIRRALGAGRARLVRGSS